MRTEDATVTFRTFRGVLADELPGAQTVEPVVTDEAREAFAARMRDLADAFDGMALGMVVAMRERPAAELAADLIDPAEPAGSNTQVWRMEMRNGGMLSINGGPPVSFRSARMEGRLNTTAEPAPGRFGCGCVWCQAMAAGTPMSPPTDDAARTALEGQILAYATPREVQAVQTRLRQGKLYNSFQECVIAVIAQQRGESYWTVQIGAPARIGELRVPDFERWLGIFPRGATPATNETAAKLDGWLTDWLARQGAVEEVAEEVAEVTEPAVPARRWPTLQERFAARGQTYTFHPRRGMVRRE